MGGQAAPRVPGRAPHRLAGVLQGDRPRRDHAGERGAGGVFPPHPDREPTLSGVGGSWLADGPGRGVHHVGRARRRVRLHGGRVARGGARRPLDLQRVAADALFPGQYGIRPLPPHAHLAGRVPARHGTAPPAVTRAVGLLLFVAVAPPVSAATAQQTSPYVAAERAESLRLAGRPWHAAETLLAAAAREPRLNATFIVEGAKAELHARRYDRARSLLVGQPWLEDYGDGAALAVLAEAEARLGLGMQAAGHYAAARARARGPRGPARGARGSRVGGRGRAGLGGGRVWGGAGDGPPRHRRVAAPAPGARHARHRAGVPSARRPAGAGGA